MYKVLLHPDAQEIVQVLVITIVHRSDAYE
jgi:hypothetical protein